MKIDINEVKEELKIDKNIDKSILDQAEKLGKYDFELVAAQADLELLQFQLKRRRASLSLEERENAKKSGNKLTENWISDILDSHPELLDIEAKLLEARKNVKALQSIVGAFEQRKDMLVQKAKRELNADSAYSRFSIKQDDLEARQNAARSK